MASTSRNDTTSNIGKVIKKDLKLATFEDIFSLASIVKAASDLTWLF